MKEAMKRGDLFPLFCVSADHMIGIKELLTETVQLMPSAYEMEEIHAFKGAEGNKTVERSEEHTSELQSRLHLVCRLLLEKKKDHTKKVAPSRNHSICTCLSRTLPYRVR